jgi:hypothetical protein
VCRGANSSPNHHGNSRLNTKDEYQHPEGIKTSRRHKEKRYSCTTMRLSGENRYTVLRGLRSIYWMLEEAADWRCLADRKSVY